MLFDSRLDRMAEEEVEALADAQISELPSFLPSREQASEEAQMALTILGGMALHKYQSISPR